MLFDVDFCGALDMASNDLVMVWPTCLYPGTGVFVVVSIHCSHYGNSFAHCQWRFGAMEEISDV